MTEKTRTTIHVKMLETLMMVTTATATVTRGTNEENQPKKRAFSHLTLFMLILKSSHNSFSKISFTLTPRTLDAFAETEQHEVKLKNVTNID